MHRNADRTRLVGDRTCHSLSNPPGGIGGKFISAAVFKFFNGFHQAHVAFLDQVQEGKAAVGVFLGNRDDKSQVGLDHFALGFLALVHPALKHADVFFELIESAAGGKFPLGKLSF